MSEQAPAPQPEQSTALDLGQTMTKAEYDAWVEHHNTTPTLQEPVYNHSAGHPDFRRVVQTEANAGKNQYGPTYGADGKQTKRQGFNK